MAIAVHQIMTSDSIGRLPSITPIFHQTYSRRHKSKPSMKRPHFLPKASKELRNNGPSSGLLPIPDVPPHTIATEFQSSIQHSPCGSKAAPATPRHTLSSRPIFVLDGPELASRRAIPSTTATLKPDTDDKSPLFHSSGPSPPLPHPPSGPLDPPAEPRGSIDLPESHFIYSGLNPGHVTTSAMSVDVSDEADRLFDLMTSELPGWLNAEVGVPSDF
jgi:hypothetical protein